MIRYRLWVASPFLLGAAFATLAADDGAGVQQRSTLSKAEEIREQWSSQGIDIDPSLRLEGFRSRGGQSSGGAATALTDIKLRLDFEKALELQGVRAYIELMNHSLGRINAAQVGSMTGVSNIETAQNVTKFYRFWVEKSGYDEQLSLRVGLIPLEDEFFTMESAATVIHPTAGPQGDLAVTRGPSIYNNAGSGFRLKTQTADRSYYAMVAALDRPNGDSNYLRGRHLNYERLGGTHLIAELGHAPLTAAKENDPDLEDFRKSAVGFWRYAPKERDLVELDSLGRARMSRNWGWYAQTEKTLFRWGDDQALTGFIRLSGADGHTSAIQRSMNAGVRVRGAIPGRTDDIFGLMYVEHAFSRSWRQSMDLLNIPTAAKENALEVHYVISLQDKISLQPMFQWIENPGGLRDVSDAKVLGARLMVSF